MTTREHQMVAEFAQTFGHPFHTQPVDPLRKTRKLRVALMEEEYQETIAAAAALDIIEVADGCGDVGYIAHGTLHAYGLPYKPSIITGPPVGLARAIARYLHTEKEFLRGAYMFTHNVALNQGLSDLAHTLNQILVEVRVIARDYGIPYDKVFAEIHASNMSKLGDDGKPIYLPSGKVGKGPNYFKPDIRRILVAAHHPIVTAEDAA